MNQEAKISMILPSEQPGWVLCTPSPLVILKSVSIQALKNLPLSFYITNPISKFVEYGFKTKSIFIILLPSCGLSNRVLDIAVLSLLPACLEWVTIWLMHLRPSLSGSEGTVLEKMCAHLSFQIIQTITRALAIVGGLGQDCSWC